MLSEKDLRKLPPIGPFRPVDSDWLVTPTGIKTGVYRGDAPKEIVMTNGLISRTWRLAPNAATVGFDNLMTGESIIRGVKPEAAIEVDGCSFDIGGLLGQEEYAYLKHDWVDSFTSDSKAFQLVNFEVGGTTERFGWKRSRYSSDLPWPPPGASLTLHFRPPEAGPTVPFIDGLHLTVHYEMYDGIPLMAKWLEICNCGQKAYTLNTFASEILAVVDWESVVGQPERWEYPNIHIESDYAFGGSVQKEANHTTHWVPDSQYSTQVNYKCQAPVMMVSKPPIGPDVVIRPGERFQSFRTFELIHDSTDRERKGLAQRRMYRTLAPWVTENPIFMHIRNSDEESVRLAVDQAAECGFEMVILSFGSGLNMENEDTSYMSGIKALADYAHSKGIELGGYSLFSSRSISTEDDVDNPEGIIFGHAPCLGSHWGLDYLKRLKAFITESGFDVLEHDGPYPGDICNSTKHPGHTGRNDSQWQQYKMNADFYKWCRAKGIYVNAPDWYFLNGTNKSGMGYREVNWSLPRERQLILGRQNIFDGTWEKTPSMGWMFVPLTEYHGGGEAATIEPLSEHLDTYEAHLINNFAAGVQAAYRGIRLYDTDETKKVICKWVEFYKKYRDILDSDIIHVRRADGRDIDCLLHVNPTLPIKGLAVVYNPLDKPVQKALKLPLYYSGLTTTAQVSQEDGESNEYALDREYNIRLQVELRPRSAAWYVIR